MQNYNIKYAREFGKRLEDRLICLKMTQADLSKITGVSAPYISQLIHGDHVPRADMVAKLAFGLAMTTDELINFTV